MAKINLNTLPKKQTAAPYQYKDIHLDLIPEFTVTGELYKTPEQKDFKADYDVTAIKNSIRNLLTTSPGEKILNPAYGCDLRGLLFEQVTKNIGEQIGNIIYKQITTFEPRIRIDNIKIADLGFYINLDRRTDRKEHLLKNLEEYNITGIERKSAREDNKTAQLNLINSNFDLYKYYLTMCL